MASDLSKAALPAAGRWRLIESYFMDLTRTAYGTWSGGRFMHFGEPLSEERFLQVFNTLINAASALS